MKLQYIGFLLVFTGIILVFVATLLQVYSALTTSSEEVKVGGGGCIIILFIPICFGVGEPALITTLMVLGLVLSQ